MDHAWPPKWQRGLGGWVVNGQRVTENRSAQTTCNEDELWHQRLSFGHHEQTDGLQVDAHHGACLSAAKLNEPT